MDGDSTESLQERLAIYRRNLAHLLRQAAQHGGEQSAPILVNNEIFESRKNIKHIKKELRARGAEIKDEPDDEPPPESPESSSTGAIGGQKGAPAQTSSDGKEAIRPSQEAKPWYLRQTRILVGISAAVAVALVVVVFLVVYNQRAWPEKELREAGAYVQIESVDPSPEITIFSEDEEKVVEVLVNYYLPGPANSPTLQFRYVDGTSPITHTMVIEQDAVGRGNGQLRMIGKVKAPKRSDVHQDFVRIEVVLTTVEEPGKPYAIALDYRDFPLK